RERDTRVHQEHAHRVATADRNHAPTVDGGVGANGLRAGDGNRRGAAAGEGHGAVETPAAGEAEVECRLGTTRTRAGADDTREGGRGCGECEYSAQRGKQRPHVVLPISEEQRPLVPPGGLLG